MWHEKLTRTPWPPSLTPIFTVGQKVQNCASMLQSPLTHYGFQMKQRIEKLILFWEPRWTVHPPLRKDRKISRKTGLNFHFEGFQMEQHVGILWQTGGASIIYYGPTSMIELVKNVRIRTFLTSASALIFQKYNVSTLEPCDVEYVKLPQLKWRSYILLTWFDILADCAMRTV